MKTTDGQQKFDKQRATERREWNDDYTIEELEADEYVFGSSFIQVSKYQYSAIRWALALHEAKIGNKSGENIRKDRKQNAICNQACWCSNILTFLRSWQDIYKKPGKEFNGKKHWFYCTIKSMKDGSNKGSNNPISTGLIARQQQRYLKILSEIGLIEIWIEWEQNKKRTKSYKKRYIRLNLPNIARLFKQYRNLGKGKLENLLDAGLL